MKNILESMKDWDFLNISVAQCNPCKVFEFAIPLLLALMTKSNHCFKLLQKTKKYRHYLQLVLCPEFVLTSLLWFMVLKRSGDLLYLPKMIRLCKAASGRINFLENLSKISSNLKICK